MATKRRSTSIPGSGSAPSTEPTPRKGRSRNGSTAGSNGQRRNLGEVQAQIVAAGAAAASSHRTPRRGTSKTTKEVTSPVVAVETAQVAPATYDHEVSERERIALLAYSLWEARGGQGGSPEEDWFRAEQEIRRQRRV